MLRTRCVKEIRPNKLARIFFSDTHVSFIGVISCEVVHNSRVVKGGSSPRFAAGNNVSHLFFLGVTIALLARGPLSFLLLHVQSRGACVSCVLANRTIYL